MDVDGKESEVAFIAADDIISKAGDKIHKKDEVDGKHHS